MNTVVLLSPEIPQNTGNIARTCAVTGTSLHLVGSLGFSIDEKQARRAGLDYWDYVSMQYFENMENHLTELLNSMDSIYLLSSHGKEFYSEKNFTLPTCLVFGNEGSGTPQHIMELFEARNAMLRIPMLEERRSLNLAVSVSIVLYEVLRQQKFDKLV